VGAIFGLDCGLNCKLLSVFRSKVRPIGNDSLVSLLDPVLDTGWNSKDVPRRVNWATFTLGCATTGKLARA